MRVVGICPRYPPKSRVGAWLSTHRCLVELVSRGHTVEVGTVVGQPDPTYEIDGITVHGGQGVVGRLLQHADVLVSHLGDDGKAHRFALEAGIPSVRMAHGGTLDSSRCDGAALVVFNSQTFADQIGWDGPQMVVHPPIDPADYRTTPGSCVTLVNLSAEKGVQTFVDIARRMPDVQFLGVLGCYGIQAPPDLPNITVIPPVVDMRNVFGQTCVLLMPSERETWGRVGIEAFASGIPVIANPTSGLRESLGDAGLFVERRQVDHWVSLVRSLTSNGTRWRHQSELAFKRSAELEPTADLIRFADAVEEVAT